MSRTALVSSPVMATTFNLPAFILGILVISYLFTFVIFAVVRILSGLSIQRVGYFALKRLSYEFRNGMKVDIRKLGFNIHRPTFAQPTWFSLVVGDTHLMLDLLPKEDESEDYGHKGNNGNVRPAEGQDEPQRDKIKNSSTKIVEWVRISKDLLNKKIHRWIKWIRLVDIVFTNTTITIAHIGSVQIGSVTMMVDTRRKAADKNRMFDHCTEIKEGQRPIEWLFGMKSVLFFQAENKDPIELLDHSMFSVYGILGDGAIRDVALGIKVGRISLPCDELLSCMGKFKGTRKTHAKKFPRPKDSGVSLSTVMEEMAVPGSRTERMAEVVMESKEVLQSFLKGIREVQFAIGYLFVTKDIPGIQPAGKPLQVMLGMKELGMDIHRLDQKSPAHRMYFSSKDIAHQALLAALSISVSINDGVQQDKLVYVPMVTMTSRTTLFSKTIQIVENSESDRNANILFANMVVTSPSIDLEPRHLPLLVAFLQSGSKGPSSPSSRRAHLISRLLPKAIVKFSIQEPVVRIALPPTEPEYKETDEMDMLVSSLSSISFDVEATHEAEGQAHYSLSSAFRVTSHILYYRAASGIHHDLLHTETFDLKTQLNATPEVQVFADAYLSSFSLRLVRPEIVQGLKQMMSQFRRNYKTDKLRHPETPGSPNFLRKAPMWLDQFKFECNDFSIEIAGIDPEISESIRGAAIQMDSWALDYRCRKCEPVQRPTPRRRTTSRTLSRDDTRNTGSSKGKPIYFKNPTDGRKLAFHVRELQGFIVESQDTWEQDPFMQMPHFDIAFSTSNDHEGPLLLINSFSKLFYFNYSLYRHYSVIVASQVLREAFGMNPDELKDVIHSIPKTPNTLNPGGWGEMDVTESPINDSPEFMSIDIKIQHVRIKADMPSDPPMMMEVHTMDMGRHRWGFPFCKAKNFRLYAESPKIPQCWSRLVSLRHFRLDLRENRKQADHALTAEKSIDFSADAIRLAIPHQLILYKVTDNVINTIKASQQMHHRFKTGTNEYILEKKPEGPKKVPRISLRTKALLLELEDDPFETQLGLIYRVGLSEQKKRLAREAAFEAKVKKMGEKDRRKSWETTRTTAENNIKVRGRSRTWRTEKRTASLRTDSPEVKTRSKSAHYDGQNMRYDPEGAAEPTESASVTIDEAWERLQEHNSIAWIKRIKWAKEYHRTRIAEAREAFWGDDNMPSEHPDTETILGLPLRPALMASFFNDVHIVVDKPSFPLEELPKFLHRVGKGLPEDTLFSLLVPVNIKVDFSEARVLLRDYPLPLIHVPQMRAVQSSRLHSWSLETDFVLAEEFTKGPESMREVKVDIIPSTKDIEGHGITVRRTVSPVKSYSDIRVSINTSYATRITWCTAYQPAIQDMMMVFETFTKPHVDPSEKTGFWDKIRLILHSQITLAWEGDGDVHLTLKGSRDPYKITGDGAGFVMCWRGDVRWDVARDEDPKKFMKIDSEEYLLAIPDFTRHVTEEIDIGAVPESKSFLSASSIKNGALFKKVVMKLSGRVSWLVGLQFEQEISNEEDWKLRQRSFNFKPHYDVTLKSPQYAKAPPGEVYDAFKGFRSHHLHLSLSILSPVERDWSPSNAKPSASYNTIHLTPRFFTHFYAWWGLFSGVMSLPIRQGALWPGPEKSNKKFGRHLATIKYKLCLSPLFISHVYKHHDKDELGNNVDAATGLKAKLDSFLLDIHQRREEALPNPKSTTMKINQAELDFHSADIRAVSAITEGLSMGDLMNQVSDSADEFSETLRYERDIADGDYAWIDMDDFVELDWVMPKNRMPKTKIMPLAYTPRFTYFRQTDHSNNGTAPITSPFGDEASHDCIMSQNNDPREIQCALVQARLERVNQQMSKNKEAIDLLAQHTKDNPTNEDLRLQSENLIQQSSILFNKLEFLQVMLRRISSKLDEGEKIDLSGHGDQESDSGAESDNLVMDSSLADYVSDFDNRFIVHNMQAKWNNSLRNIILKYIHQVGQRRGFIYYMSRRAVKFILDIIEEQRISGQQYASGKSTNDYSKSEPSNTDQENDDATIESRIQQLLNDDIKVAIADDKKPIDNKTLDEAATKLARDDLGGDVAEQYMPLNSYHVRLIAPQIQMQSEKNKGAAVLVAAQGMQLKIVSIMDCERMGDDVSGLVQRRFALNLDNTQFFVSHHQDFVPQSMSLHSANRYGAPNGSSWPPWVPLESMFDFRNNPVGFSRVVERTSATLRYDKHNSLRLKYSDQVSGLEAGLSATKNGLLDSERRIDYVWVDFPRVEASCDSSQYFAMYIIVLDLLLYAEPLEKLRSEKLEKIMLASDFSDLTGTPEMVECLQSRIHQLAEIKQYFQLNARTLDVEGWKSRIAVEQDLASCEEELFFMMKAITTAQRKYEDRSSRSSGVVRWYLTASEIIWHLLREKADPLMDIALKKAAYERVDNADGSNYNTVEVEMVKGYNLLPDAAYPEMIAPYFESSRSMTEVRQTKMLRVYWNMLEAIAGIPIMDHFEVNLFPMKLQLERDIGEKIFEYIFPGVGKSAFENGGFSPFMVHAMKPVPDKDAESESDGEIHHPEIPRPLTMDDSSSTKSDTSGVELRLRPTMSHSVDHRPKSSHSERARPKTSSASSLFGRSHKVAVHKSSADSLSLMSRRSIDGGSAPSLYVSEKGKKIQLFSRSSSNNDRHEKQSDELSQMMSRASNYMTLSYIKIPSVVLCLSYKGRGESNFEDIHEFVFRMPMLEYRNKTWSNLDLAIHLKKDIMRALISHTGAILQNKIMNHRPSRAQPNLLRMMANNGSLATTPPTPFIIDKDSAFESPRGSLEIDRPSTGNLSAPSLFSRGGMSTPATASVYSSSTSIRNDQSSSSTIEDDKGGIFHNALGRHLSHLAAVARHRDGIEGDTEESIKKKSRLLLGKKVFGGL